jgi:hypothetical protein
MKFEDAAAVDQICYEMRLADYPRSKDRALVNSLLNGSPPYTEEEVEKNGIAFNVNFLEPTRLAHDARMQFYGGFLKPSVYFNCRTDMGPPHKRTERSGYVTQKLAKIMKRSLTYYETFRSKFALDVLHGIGPSVWDTSDFWCPDAIGVEDVLVPANTLLTMKNLPFLALYHSYTAPELIRLTRDRQRAKEAGWNLDLVDRCLQWLDQETMALSHNNWPEVWSPEKMGERVKGDGGFYASDSVPTVDCFDFYFWNDEDKEEGWCRRIILDSWSTPQDSGGIYKMQPNSNKEWGRNQFLFSSKNRKVAQSWHNIAAFQFADLSAVAPFHYHTVRGLGYLLYAVGHLQNRLRCRFNEAVWESTLMYLRVRSLDDAERALKVLMSNRGFIDETVQFVPAQERFQLNAPLVQLGLSENEKIILQNASSWRQRTEHTGDRTEKTKFQVMAELQAMTSLISSGLQQAYRYQVSEYREIFRRFCQPDSRDPDVKEFRAACLACKIPEKMLVPEAWDIEPERVLGGGNKTLEMAIAEQLMAFRHLYDPDPQRQILRDFTQAITEDPGRATSMVPDSPAQVTDSIHDAQLASAALMMGLPVTLKTGMNHIEYVDTLMRNLALTIQKIEQTGSMATMDQIVGMGNIAQSISEHIQIVAQDPNEKARVTAWNGAMTKMMNMIKAYAQRLDEQQKQQGPQMDAEAQAKIQAMMMQAEAKAQNTRESHAQRTAQRQIQFEMEQRREEQAAQAELMREQGSAQDDVAKEHSKTQLKIAADREKAKMDLRLRTIEDRLDLIKQKAEADIEVEAERRKSKVKTDKKPEAS